MKRSSLFPRLLLLALGPVVLAAPPLLGFARLRMVLFHVAPFLLLIAALAPGCYPGERLIVALVARASGRQRPAAAISPRIGLPAPPTRGGGLLALALAGRAPPGRLAATRSLLPS